MKQIITILIALFTIMSCGTPAGNQDPSKAVLDNILSRKSVRSYTEQEVSQEQIETILKAAMAAPSGVNLQPWRFVVVREQTTKEKLAVGFNKMIAQAPVAIVVCGVTTRSDGQRCHGEPSAGGRGPGTRSRLDGLLSLRCEDGTHH